MTYQPQNAQDFYAPTAEQPRPDTLAGRQMLARVIQQQLSNTCHVFVKVTRDAVMVTVVSDNDVDIRDVKTIVVELLHGEDDTWRLFWRRNQCIVRPLSSDEFRTELRDLIAEQKKVFAAAQRQDELRCGVRDTIERRFGESPVVRVQLGDRQHTVHIQPPWDEVMEFIIERCRRS
jgi:hypothetical protein